MRPLSALLWVLAAIVTMTACSGPGPDARGKPRPTPVAATRTVGCDQIIQQVNAPGVGGKVVLGVLAVPPAQVEAGAPTGTLPWAYFSKWGIAVRTGSPAVLVTVPQAWRNRAAVDW
jgi:hypothetical protein